MKKNGFTLAEVLITLGIIGVAAALLTPVIGNAVPDKNKTKVINLHKAVASATDSFLDNKAIYYPKGNNDICKGLACQYQPLVAPYNSNTYQGKSKYGYLLASNLNVQGDITSSEGTLSFVTTDGVSWTIQSNNIGESIITMDLNGNSGKNCSYNKTLCPKPDQFEFFVGQYGDIKGNDPLTTAYLGNSLNLNDKKTDYNTASSDKNTYLAKVEDVALNNGGNDGFKYPQEYPGGNSNGNKGGIDIKYPQIYEGDDNNGKIDIHYPVDWPGGNNDDGGADFDKDNFQKWDGEIGIVGGDKGNNDGKDKDDSNNRGGGSSGGGASSGGDGSGSWSSGNGWLKETIGHTEYGVEMNQPGDLYGPSNPNAGIK